MTILSYIVQTIALAGALSILLYDKRGSQYCRRTSLIAYLLFVLFGALFFATVAHLTTTMMWLLVAIVAIQVINLVLAHGNVKQISADTKPNNKPTTTAKPRSIKHRKHRHVRSH